MIALTGLDPFILHPWGIPYVCNEAAQVCCSISRGREINPESNEENLMWALGGDEPILPDSETILEPTGEQGQWVPLP